MAVRFKLDDEGHLTWDADPHEEIAREDAAVIATASIGNMLYGVSNALYNLAEEFQSKDFYDENIATMLAMAAGAKDSIPKAAKATPKTKKRKR